MMKRFWSLLLALLLVSCLAVTATAAENSGTCGENLTWEFDSSTATLTISGTGRMDDYSNQDEIPWGVELSSDIQSLAIEEGVTAIGKNAFKNCAALETVSLPQSLTGIGDYAFLMCSSLRSIYLPEGVTEIGYYAFGGNASLTEVALPASLKQVGESAFRSCKLLDTVVYGGSTSDRGNIVFERYNGEIFAAQWRCADGILEGQFAPIVITGQIREEIGKPMLYWDRPMNPEARTYSIEYYEIYRSEKRSSGFKLLEAKQNWSNYPTYTDKTAEVGKTYYYKLRAITGENGMKSEFSNTVKIICRLKTPSSSVYENEDTGVAEVTWNTVKGAKKYYIYRSTSMFGTYKRIGTAIKSRVYKDTDAKIGKVYYYKVKAIHENSDANSFFSEPTWGMRRLRTPTVKVTLTSNGDPKVTWNTIKGAEKYYIYRSTSEDGTYTHVKTTVTARSFVDKKAKAGKRYYYTVRAIDEGGGHSQYAWAKSVKAK